MTTTEAARTRPTRTAPDEDLPPLAVTTQGIPAAELLPPTAPAEVTRAQRAQQALAWALSGVLVLLAVVAGVLLRLPGPSGAHLGLGDAAWSEYRAGERSVLVVPDAHGPGWVDYRAGERSD